MKHTRIKICGISKTESAHVAVNSGANAIGLVFVKKSPRYVSIEQAKLIIESLPPFVEPVGLFVDAPLSDIIKTANKLNLKTIQLHGKEPVEIACELEPLKIIKMVHFDDDFEENLSRWTAPEIPNLSAILIDTPPAKKGELPGGSGRAVNWEKLAAALENLVVDTDLPPIILAGGLTAQNVSEAISIVNPYAVDVSSGVESAPGVKDTNKINSFCEAVRVVS